MPGDCRMLNVSGLIEQMEWASDNVKAAICTESAEALGYGQLTSNQSKVLLKTRGRVYSVHLYMYVKYWVWFDQPSSLAL